MKHPAAAKRCCSRTSFATMHPLAVPVAINLLAPCPDVDRPGRRNLDDHRRPHNETARLIGPYGLVAKLASSAAATSSKFRPVT